MEKNMKRRLWTPQDLQIPKEDEANNFKHFNPGKLLPHIKQQYQYRINNTLLVSKILNPKRDKIIIDSLLSTEKKNSKAHKSLYHTAIPRKQNGRNYNRNFVIKREKQNDNYKPAKSYQNCIIKPKTCEHSRMGKRDVLNETTNLETMNTTEYSKSSIFVLNKSRERFIGKIRRNVLSDSLYLDEIQQNSRRQELQNQKCIAPLDKSLEVFQNLPYKFDQEDSSKIIGLGAVILSIDTLEILCKPELKKQTLIALEIQKTSSSSIHFNKTKIMSSQIFKSQKTLASQPTAYLNFNSYNSSKSIQFGLDMKRLGDFIILKILKFRGLESEEIGCIDIDLSPYKYRHMMRKETGSLHPQIYIQQEINNENQRIYRHVFCSNILTNVYKASTGLQTDIQINLCFRIFAKKFILSEF